MVKLFYKFFSILKINWNKGNTFYRNMINRLSCFHQFLILFILILCLIHSLFNTLLTFIYFLNQLHTFLCFLIYFSTLSHIFLLFSIISCTFYVSKLSYTLVNFLILSYTTLFFLYFLLCCQITFPYFLINSHALIWILIKLSCKVKMISFLSFFSFLWFAVFLICSMSSMVLFHHIDATSYKFDLRQSLATINLLLKAGLSNLKVHVTSLFESSSGQVRKPNIIFIIITIHIIINDCWYRH